MLMRSKFSRLYKNLSLSTHYLLFACTIIILITAFSLLIGITDYKSFRREQAYDLKITATRLDNMLSDIFDTTYRMHMFMGKQIAQHGANDLSYIYRLFKNYADIKNNTSTFYSWSIYDWTDNKIKLIVNTGIGISKPVNFSDRVYLRKAKQFPWHLWLSEPLVGYPSGQWVIAAATGITGNRGNYLGAIGVGINIQQLTQVLESVINPSKASFLIVNNKGKIILTSEDSLTKRSAIFSKQLQEYIRNSASSEGQLLTPFEDNGIAYSYYHKIQNYPYYILTGYNTNLQRQKLIGLIFPKIGESIGFALISLMLLLFFRYWFVQPVSYLAKESLKLAQGKLSFRPPNSKAPEILHLSKALLLVKRYLYRNKVMQIKLKNINQSLSTKNEELISKQLTLSQAYKQLEKAIKLAKDSDQAKEKFIRQIHADLKMPITQILNNTEQLISSLINSQQKKYLTYLHTIYLAALELKNFIRTIINIEEIDIKEVITESVKIHSKDAFNKNIAIETQYPEMLPLIYADPLRLKQAVVGLIYRAVENTPCNGYINIVCEYIKQPQSGIGTLKIIIQDTGFGLSQADYDRIKAKYTRSHGTDGTELELTAIQTIIELHQGQFDIVTNWGQGTQVTILLPCKQSIFEKKVDNLYHFPKL